jgi:N-acetylmuramoyl-L-alanine amidase CwlA
MPFVVVSRSSWGAKPPKSKVPMTGAKADVFIHHTAGLAGPADKEAAIMRELQQSAFNENYRDIEYHFVVFPSGNVYEGRGWGLEGGATRDHNTDSYAISHAGNYQSEGVSQAQIEVTRWLIAEGQKKGFIAKSPIIRGHRDVNATVCPGSHLYARLPDIRKPWLAQFPSYRITHKSGSSGVINPPAPGQSAFPITVKRMEEILRDEGWVKGERL